MEQTNNYLVYKHTTPSGKVYIGITKQRVSKRWKNGQGYEGCTAFYRAVQKYGWQNIEHEIIAQKLTKEDACSMEQNLIAKYKSHDPQFGYNLTHGGEHYEPNEEWRKRLSESNKRYYREHPEAKERVAEQSRGRACTEENKEYFRAKMKQYYIDHPEQRERVANTFRGMKRSEEFCRKLGERKSVSIICIETGKHYKSLREASEDLNINRSGITQMLRGKAKTCGGYTFAYLEVTNGNEGNKEL